MCSSASRSDSLARTSDEDLPGEVIRFELHEDLPSRTAECAMLQVQVANVLGLRRTHGCTRQSQKRGTLLGQVAAGSKPENRNAAVGWELRIRRRANPDRVELAPGIPPKLGLLLQRLGRIRCDEDLIQPSHAAAESIHHAKRTSR
jgi:hypothetical protein